MRRAHAHVNRNVHSAVRPHAQSCTTQTKPSGQRQARKSLVTCPPHTGRPEPRVAWSCPRERGIPGQAPTPRVVVRLIACRAPCRREPSLHRCPERGLRRPPHTSGNHPETLLAGKARPGEGRRLPRMRRGASFGDSLVSIFALRLSTARKECGGRAGGSGERPGRRGCAHSAGTLVSPGGQKQRPAAELSRRTKLGGEEEDAGCGSRRTKSGLAARARGRWGPGQKWGGLAVWEPGTAVQKAWPSAWLSGRACARVATQSCWPPRAAADVTAGEPGRRGKRWPGSRGASGPAGDAALSSSHGARRPACGRGCCPHRELGGRPRRAGRHEPSPARPPAPAPWSPPMGPGASSPTEQMGKQTSPPFPPPVGCPAGRGRRGGLWRPHLPG